MKTRKALAIFMAVAMVFCYMPFMAYADVTADANGTTTAVGECVFEDMPEEGVWSTTALKAAINNGLLNGFAENDGSYIKPNDPLTRAQMATIINRAFGAEEMASLSGANDVYATEWYFTEMQKAVKMGTMMLDTSMRPNDSITRQEAFTVLGRALKMQDGTAADFNTFGDADQVASWATSGMGAMVKAGYIKGDNNLLTPTASMTRAQFAKIMDNVIKEYITVAGTVTTVAAGNVMVNVDGVTLKNLTITGDLVVGDGVGDGTLTLDNVIIKGDLIARGGGVDSIVITGGSVNGKVIIAKVDGKIRVYAENGAEIEVVEIDDGSDDVIMEGTFGTIEVTAADTPVIMRNATVTKMDVNTVGAGNVSVEKGSTVATVNVGASATGSKVAVAGTVTNFNTSAGNTELSGAGTVTNANVKDGANGTKITTPKTVITNAGATGVTAGGGTAVGANTTATNNASGNGATVTTAITGSTGTTTTTVVVGTLTFDKSTLLIGGVAVTSAAGVYSIDKDWTTQSALTVTATGDGFVAATTYPVYVKIYVNNSLRYTFTDNVLGSELNTTRYITNNNVTQHSSSSLDTTLNLAFDLWLNGNKNAGDVVKVTIGTTVNSDQELTSLSMIVVD